MSTVKSNALQLGQSLTASNNFTWYQPSTPDGTVRLGNGNSGSVTDLVTLTSAGNLGIGTSSPGEKLSVNGNAILGSEIYRGSASSYIRLAGGDTSSAGANIIVFGQSHATAPGKVSINAIGTGSVDINAGGATRGIFDSSGNLGLGVTPSAWVSGNKAFQIGTYSAIDDGAGGGGGPGLSGNAYEYSSGAYKYLQSYYATLYRQNYNGQHQWFIAPSGTAGNAISFTQAMTLTAAANLLLGGTSDPGGSNALYIANRGSVPGTPSGGGVIYVESGALKYKGSSGTVTTLANA